MANILPMGIVGDRNQWCQTTLSGYLLSYFLWWVLVLIRCGAKHSVLRVHPITPFCLVKLEVILSASV